MELPKTTHEALAWTIEPWGRLESEWAGLSEPAMLAPGAVGEWSVRDLVTHLGASNRWMAGQLDALRSGELPTAEGCYGHEQAPPPSVNMLDNEDRNAWYQSVRESWSLPEVQRECAESFAWLVAGISWLPDEELAAEYTIAPHEWVGHVRRWRPDDDDKLKFPLGFIIAGYAWHHFNDHAKALQEARRALV